MEEQYNLGTENIMSKIRIYELAKELGVENKIVITKAQEIGVPGKLSHSNTLDSDEADQIRRSLLRQAVANGSAPQDSEVMTRRVDKVTGESQAVVEKRSGNVIRRRRATDEEVAAKDPLDAPELMAPEQLPEEDEKAETSYTSKESKVEEAESLFIETPEAPQEEEVVEEGPEEDGKKAGPRVLGRISLPTKPKPAPQAKQADRDGKSALPRVVVPVVDEEEEAAKKKALNKKGRRREISRVDLLDYEGRDFRRAPKASARSHKDKDRGQLGGDSDANRPKQGKKAVEMHDSIIVGELAKQMSVKVGEVIAKLMELGVMATINHALDFTTASLIAEEMGFEIKSTAFNEEKILVDETHDDPSQLKERPPVVTIMGHVDHGKTSLLDYIRKTAVAAKEAGGITQHIGAYSVPVNGRKITFLDTPGHAAFTAMRARGANVTDIVILVCAADDGVMPQTIEAINHARAANVPIIVAVNKIDKPGSNLDRVKQQLTEKGLQPEDWGGDTMYFPVSALKGTGIKELLEGILLLAEVKELKANPDSRASGTIIEAKQEKGRGAVATLLVQRGTLRIGDIFVCGAQSGRVRSMSDYMGKKLTEATPSTPVELTGLEGIPSAGDDLIVVESEQKARQVAQNRTDKIAAEERALASGPISLEEFAKRANNIIVGELNIILKADVDGSVEAVKTAMEKLSTEKVKVRVVHAAVGGIIESDVQLAIASKAVIVGFNVRPEPRAQAEAERGHVELRFYRIIYELLDDMKTAMAGLLPPVQQEVPLGRVEVRETFSLPKAGTIAGCYVVDGSVKRGAFVRLVRDSRVIHEGKMSSLRRFKDDVREVNSGYECGIGIENYNDIKQGDTIEVYEFKEIAATLD